MGIVFFIDGFIWFAMPLLLTWLVALVYRIKNKDFKQIYFAGAFILGLLMMLFGPRCLCSEPVDLLLGSLFYSFLFSILWMSLLILLSWFKE
jgi:hypothetical protein